MEGGWLNLSGLSIPATGVATFAAMAAGATVGHMLRRRTARWSARDAAESVPSVAQEGYLLGAALSTLGLLLAFSFGMVINRYEARRELVVRHANAIGTAYLRAQWLDEPARSRLSGLLVEYTENRIRLASGPGSANAYLATNDRLLTEIWATLRSARQSASAQALTTPLLLTFNEVIDLDAERRVASELRMPREILILLFCYLVITAGVVGYQVDGPRGRRAAAVLFVLIALSLMFIADINRPMTGLSREPQKPMLLLLQSLRAQPPTVFGGDGDAFGRTAP